MPAKLAASTASRSCRARTTFAARSVRGAIYAVIVVMAALFADRLAPYDPRAMLRVNRRIARYLPISSEHWLGTTAGGRDVLSQLIYGARAALEVGLTAAVAVVAIGTLLGLLAGYLGGWVDRVITRLCRHRAWPAVPAVDAGAGGADPPRHASP